MYLKLKKSLLTKKVAALLASLIIGAFSTAPSVAHAQENVQIFQSVPQAQETDEGRNAVQCAKSMARFFSHPRSDIYGFIEEFRDYFRDFLLWPAHYRDVYKIEEQLHHARREVVETFFRCDLTRMPSVMNAYWRLSAELYYLRHYVDTNGGYPHIISANVGEREAFKQRMVQSFIGSIPETEEKQRALFEGYFDLFEAKYKDRAKSYGTFGDLGTDRLKEKIEHIAETLRSLKDMAQEDAEALGGAASDAKDGLVAAPGKVADAFNSPKKTLKSLGTNILDRFKICPYDGNPDSCQNLAEGVVNVWGGAKSAVERVLGTNEAAQEKNDRKTYEDVQFAVTQDQLKRTEDEMKSEMQARYELLYGQVNGDGVAAMAGAMKKLLEVLGPSEVQGSLSPLEKLKICTDEVRSRECK